MWLFGPARRPIAHESLGPPGSGPPQHQKGSARRPETPLARKDAGYPPRDPPIPQSAPQPEKATASSGYRERPQKATSESIGRSRSPGGVTGVLEKGAVRHTRRAHRLTGPATQTAIEVELKCVGGRVDSTLRHRSHQVKATPRRVGFVAQALIRGAGWETETAVHTGVELVREVGQRGLERTVH